MQIEFYVIITELQFNVKLFGDKNCHCKEGLLYLWLIHFITPRTMFGYSFEASAYVFLELDTSDKMYALYYELRVLSTYMSVRAG